MLSYQEKYWKELDQIKVHSFYVAEYIESTVRIDRGINIFLALCSNGSIAGWAIWKDYSFVWAIIIAASQIITVLKGFFPYTNRLKALYSMSYELEKLCLDAEKQWFDVSEGKLTEEEIHLEHMKIKQRESQIVEESLKKNSLPHKERYMIKARKLALEYFQNFYGV